MQIRYSKMNALLEAKGLDAVLVSDGYNMRYLSGFTGGLIFVESGKTTSKLSDAISADLVKRGMKFVGSVIIYSYLQAIGVIDSHEDGCFLQKKQ